MDIISMLAELRTERERLSEAILALERIATGGERRRGRPPKWLASSSPSNKVVGESRKRRPFSAATRAKTWMRRQIGGAIPVSTIFSWYAEDDGFMGIRTL